MVKRSMLLKSAHLWLTAIGLVMVFSLAGCGSSEPPEKEKKDERTDQEKVLVLKQRFQQLESSLQDMETDLKIQRNRIESTREVVDSIRHSLTKGGLRGYNLDNISTTDPLLLAAIDEERDRRDQARDDDRAKEKTDDRILNGLLIVCFLVITFALFWMALNDRKTDEQPLEAGVGGAPLTEDDPIAVDPNEGDITPGIDDTGSYQYGELGGPSQSRQTEPKPDQEDTDEERSL